MQYGCIGEKLGHSFSKIIHNQLADYDYQLVELSPDAVDAFMKQRDFCAINVTIPYKQTVLPYLQHIDAPAQKIGAVNTIVHRDGELWGYNTDFYGLERLICRAGIALRDKKVLILGSGGTSKTALAVAEHLGARAVFRVSRTAREDCITYETAVEHTDTEVIINTTPAGMYPHLQGAAIDISVFPVLEGVVDAVYNPLRSTLVLQAQDRGLTAVGGLYMLVAQAAKAVEHFLDTTVPERRVEQVFTHLFAQKENIVLIGMPSCGKSTVGGLLAEQTGRELVDTDALIVEQAGKSIPDIFAQEGEAAFRALEAQVIASLAPRQGLIVATGGGAVLRQENVRALRHNGKTVFLDRPVAALLATRDRPLSSDRAALEQRYKERYDIYCGAADLHIEGNPTAEETAQRIIKECML